MTTAVTSLIWRSVLATAAAAIAACGGGGDDSTPPRTQFELRPASPVAHVGRLETAPGAGASVELRPADGISDVPYCLLRATGLRHSNGSSYQVGIGYRAADRRVFVVTLSNLETSWLVAAFNPPESEVVVHRRERRVTLHMLRSTQGMQVGWEATLSGQATIPTPAADSAACL
jgi:hypothetical protein